MDDNQMIVRPNEHPLITLASNVMVMPQIIASVLMNDHPSSQHLLQLIRNNQCPYVYAAMVVPGVTEVPDGFCRVGTIAQTEANPQGTSLVYLGGLFRAEVLSFRATEGDGWRLWIATVKKVEDENNDDYFIKNQQDVLASMIKIKHQLIRFMNRARGFYLFDDSLMSKVVDDFENTKWEDKDAVDRFIWTVLASIPDPIQSDKQPFLESTSLPERIKLCIGKLEEKLDIVEIIRRETIKEGRKRKKSTEIVKISGSDSENKERDEFDFKSQPELSERWGRFKRIKDTLGPDAQKAIMEDFAHLKNNHSGQSEWGVFLNHLDCLLDIYSAVMTPQEEDIAKVEKILDESHYGLEDVKSEIYNHLAVKTLNPNGKAPILCFVGPPGVGKTSIGKSIAEALGLKFTRASLGGVRDEADIRGHRETYVGAMPGKIIQEIRRMGVKNPVFMLDEIDKLNDDFRGDPSSALLEVLDPEQNYSFQDHYVGAPFDLSNVLFLCTANTESGIKPALLDRMNVINISGYTELQKVQITKKFLIPKQFAEVGLAGKGVKPCWPDNNPDPVISKTINGYTREAGVRELERQIHKILSIWARQYLKEADDKKPTEILISEELVEKSLGVPKRTHERVNVTEVGEAIGLAWTPTGGEIMYIQAQLTPRGRTEKDISQTGGLLEVFIQANKNAVTVSKNLLKDNKEVMKKLSENLLHLSVPDGAIQKDGPSAGITMTMAIYSELIGRPLKPFVAMSGEITIKGRIRAVGGIKEKVIAAHRDGVKEIILPIKNKINIDTEVPEEVKKDLKFNYVTHVKEVLPIVFPEE